MNNVLIFKLLQYYQLNSKIKIKSHVSYRGRGMPQIKYLVHETSPFNLKNILKHKALLTPMELDPSMYKPVMGGYYEEDKLDGETFPGIYLQVNVEENIDDLLNKYLKSSRGCFIIFDKQILITHSNYILIRVQLKICVLTCGQRN